MNSKKHGVWMKSMDEMDKVLLTNLEKDARMSLKKLAQELSLKTSTLYHRLHKLSESKTIMNFSVIVNPEKIGIILFYLLTVELNLSDDSISRKLTENLAEQLSHDLKEVFFSAMGGNNTLHMVVSFFNTQHMEEFLHILSTNEYVKNTTKVKLSFIPKGMRMFDFNEEKLMELITEKNEEKKIEDELESKDLGNSEKLRTSSINIVSELRTEDRREDNDELIPL
ncbi:MAG: Lrp/AsnC family transcriptional regulator [Candidatus Lokiarchaeota archaeon]|nr:Lrp/AsnC family transcriptional regulator [Candidatus Lokiarchaeota archaeon]